MLTRRRLLIGSSSAFLLQAESASERDARMEWWREARFGMFVHWGLYSGLAGTWDGKPVATTGGMEWIQQRVKADTDTYAEARHSAVHARSRASRANGRGSRRTRAARYLVFTTKHHDGFALHDSKVSDYDAGSVLHRDLVKEIVDALRAEGLRVGFYHSVIDWHHDQYEYARSQQLPHPLKGTAVPERHSATTRSTSTTCTREVNELVSNYGPVDILWWDYSAQDFQGEEAWRAFDLMPLVRAKQPKIIMNNRLFRHAGGRLDGHGHEALSRRSSIPKYGDFITPEQHIPATGMPGVDWETCMTMNTTWGYSEHDHDVEVGRDADPQPDRHREQGRQLPAQHRAEGRRQRAATRASRSMQAIGAWMKVNGESIYGTYGEPVREARLGPLHAEGDQRAGKTRLYLHVFDWPKDGKLVVPFNAGNRAQARLRGEREGDRRGTGDDQSRWATARRTRSRR